MPSVDRIPTMSHHARVKVVQTRPGLAINSTRWNKAFSRGTLASTREWTGFLLCLMHLDANLVTRRLWRKRRFINRRPGYPEREIVNLLPSGTRHLEVGHYARHVLAREEIFGSFSEASCRFHCCAQSGDVVQCHQYRISPTDTRLFMSFAMVRFDDIVAVYRTHSRTTPNFDQGESVVPQFGFSSSATR